MKHADSVFSGSLAKRKTTRYYVPRTPTNHLSLSLSLSFSRSLSLSLSPLRFRPQARYRFSKFSGCFFLRSKLPSRLVFFLPVFPILLSFFHLPTTRIRHYRAASQPSIRRRETMTRIVSEIACVFYRDIYRCVCTYICICERNIGDFAVFHG